MDWFISYWVGLGIGAGVGLMISIRPRRVVRSVDIRGAGEKISHLLTRDPHIGPAVKRNLTDLHDLARQYGMNVTDLMAQIEKDPRWLSERVFFDALKLHTVRWNSEDKEFRAFALGRALNIAWKIEKLSDGEEYKVTIKGPGRPQVRVPASPPFVRADSLDPRGAVTEAARALAMSEKELNESFAELRQSLNRMG